VCFYGNIAEMRVFICIFQKIFVSLQRFLGEKKV